MKDFAGRMAVPLQKYRARCSWPGAREGGLPLGRIDALRFDRRTALDELLGESPVAAAHVDPPLAVAGDGQSRKTCPTSWLQEPIMRS